MEIGDMVNKFLSWKLPRDFNPDAGISFTPPDRELLWPTGTNLLTATQARAMIEYILSPQDHANNGEGGQ